MIESGPDGFLAFIPSAQKSPLESVLLAAGTTIKPGQPQEAASSLFIRTAQPHMMTGTWFWRDFARLPERISFLEFEIP